MGGRGRTAASYIWAILPLVTFGLATPVTFGYAAARLRTAVHWLAAAAYLGLIVTMVATSETQSGSAGDVVFLLAFLLPWLGGTAHGFAIRSRVFGGRTRYQNAIEAVENRREVREQARDAARDVAMAWELRIGRPDLPRVYDDGGLVDVNHVPAQVLASLPGMTPELVGRIVETRRQCGGFTSAEELSALAQLPPALTPQLKEFAIFLP